MKVPGLKNALEILCEAIAYPDPVEPGATRCRLEVDDAAVTARLLDGRLVLSRAIDREEKDLPQLAEYAVGRMLVEEAVLAWDERAAECILWQEIQEDAEGADLLRFFETFMNSCDWWQDRARELNAPPPSYPDIVIRP